MFSVFAKKENDVPAVELEVGGTSSVQEGTEEVPAEVDCWKSAGDCATNVTNGTCINDTMVGIQGCPAATGSAVVACPGATGSAILACPGATGGAIGDCVSSTGADDGGARCEPRRRAQLLGQWR